MYEYKQPFNMTAEEMEEFKNDPTEWMLTELTEAIKHDPLLAKCYHAYVMVHEEENCDPFEERDFFVLLAYQALMSNAINLKQLIEFSKNIIIPMHSLS